MKQFSYILYMSIATLLFLNSCSTLDVEPAVDGETVAVKFNINVDDETSGTLEANTRSVQDEDGSGNDIATIHELRVIQFQGTGDDAVRVGYEQYVPNSSITNNNGTYSFIAELVASKTDCTIVFVANTFISEDKAISTAGMTLGEMKKAFATADIQSKVLSVNGTTDGTKNFPDDADYRMRLNGAAVSTVTSTTSIACQLARCAARIDVALNVKAAADITVTGVSLCSVPVSSFYYTNRTDIAAPYPDYIDTQYANYDNPIVTTAPSGGSGTDFTAGYRFYMSPSVRGTVTNNLEMLKNISSPEHATYLHVAAKYTSGGEDIPISYDYYLGENLTNDFNIRPNYRYKYNITIAERGNPKLDTRIKEWKLVDYQAVQEDANCYILNPPTNSGVSRKFRIPIRRADTFWGGNGYEDEKEYVIGTGGEWKSSIINTNSIRYKDASKRGTTPDAGTLISLTKSTGTGIGADGYFEIEVPEGVEGNLLVDVKKKKSDGTYTPTLWSWQLWITDYNPDELEDYNFQAETGHYIYSVTGGAVHRYAGDEWTTGKMKNAFIMDRNLGAYDDTQESFTRMTNYKTGNGVYYQYGRKDPKYYGCTYDYYTSATAVQRVNNPNIQYQGRLMQPKYIYHNGDQSKRSRWDDPKIAYDDDDWTKKSIFDPSPLGWVLPMYSIWSDFRLNTGTNPTTNQGGTNRGFPATTTYKGVFYWPYDGKDVDVTKNRIFYPWTGYLRESYSFEDQDANGCPIRTCYPYNNGIKAVFYLQANWQLSDNGLIPVRCVRFRKAK